MQEQRAKGVEKPTLRLNRRFAALLGLLAITGIGAALVCYAYWPGIMIDDTRWQYQQAIDNAYEDWHPPLMAWTWRQLMPLAPGPAPMFLLQLFLYWFGFALIASAAQKEGHPRLAIALACLAYLPAPLALTGTVTKDALMTGALLVASGSLLWRRHVQRIAAQVVLASGVFAGLFVAAALRFNAFFACVPLALVALPDRWTSTRPRLILSAFVATAAFLMTAPIIANLLRAEATDVQLSLMIFDIGGITEDSGVNQFPVSVRDPVAVNHSCYDPHGWDSYSDWAKKPCPMGFDAIQSLIDDEDLNPWRLWIGAIASHPLAYLKHRLTYFNLSSSFLVSSGPDFTAWSQSVPNPWGFRVHNNSVLAAITAIANGAARTPLGWPIFWIALALAVLVAGTVARLPAEPIAIAASAFLYGAGYMLVGVATGIRYYMWTFSGAALAAVLIGAELWNQRAQLAGKALAASSMLVALPTFIATAARVALT